MFKALEPPSTPSLTPGDARRLAEIAHQASGLAISPDKRGFLEMRIGRRLREIGCPDFAGYLSLLSGPNGTEERRHLVEALTTHTTAFFRERAHFDWLAGTGLPALVERGSGLASSLTIWSAACSLGSEMWTAAMITDRYSRSIASGLRWEVIGTDISGRILQRAAQALFSADEIADLPEDYRRDYLLRSKVDRSTRNPPRFRIAPELRRRARLVQANIIAPPASLQISADIVFLRNVLIYFRPEDQRRAVTTVADRLRPGGYLLTGHSERLSTVPPDLRQLGASIYQKV